LGIITTVGMIVGRHLFQVCTHAILTSRFKDIVAVNSQIVSYMQKQFVFLVQ